MKNIQHYGIFTDENLYQNQINWIVKQIENGNDDSFDDFKNAKSKLGKISIINLDKKQSKRDLQRNLKLAEQNLHGFRNSFLSAKGFSKLNSTLKMARKRALDKIHGIKKLDVTLSQDHAEKLDEIVRKTGRTKTALIEEMIEDYNCRSTAEYKEEQLELEVPDITEWHLYTRFSQIREGTLMRSISSKIPYAVADFDHKTIIFTNGTELNAHGAKNRYEFSNASV